MKPESAAREQNPYSSEALTASSLSLPFQRHPLEIELNPRRQQSASSLLSSLPLFTSSNLLRMCEHPFPEEDTSKTCKTSPAPYPAHACKGSPPAPASIGPAREDTLEGLQEEELKSILPRHPGLAGRGASPTAEPANSVTLGSWPHLRGPTSQQAPSRLRGTWGGLGHHLLMKDEA